MKRFLSLLALVLGTCLCLGAAAAEEPELLAWYTFDDEAGMGADASGNGNDLVGVINPDGVELVEGVNGKAVYFCGSSGLIAADTANDDFTDTYAGNSMTISYWAKVDLERTDDQQRRVVDSGVNGSTTGFTNVLKKNVDGDGNVTLTNVAVMGGSDWWSSAYTVAQDPAGWHHYALVYDNDACLVTTFIDGVKCAEVYAEDETIASDFTFCVGGCWAQWSWFNNGDASVTQSGFIGAVDDVKVYGGAVYDIDVLKGDAALPMSTEPVATYAVYRFNGTIEEVTTEQVIEVPTESLVAWYEFEDAEAIGKDSTGNGHDLNTKINAEGITTSAGSDGTGSSVTFGGSSALVTGEESANDFADTAFAGGALTLSFYAQSSGATGNQRVIDHGINGSADGFSFIIDNNDDYGRIQTFGVAGNHWWDTYADTWGDEAFRNAWHHYVMVIDPAAGTLTTYIDGVQESQTALNGSEQLASSFSFAIGGAWSQYDWFNGGNTSVSQEGFVGSVDDVKLFDEAIHDMEFIAGAGQGKQIIEVTETVVTKFETKGYLNNTVCVQGPAFKDFQNPVTGKWYTFLPVDLTVSGSQTWPLVGAGAHIIGDVTITIDGDSLTVNYRYYNPQTAEILTEDVAQYLNFFNDFAAITADQLENGAQTPFVFGQTYSIANDLGGAEKTNLYVCNIASFYSSNTAISRYYPGVHQATIDALVEQAGLTDLYAK